MPLLLSNLELSPAEVLLALGGLVSAVALLFKMLLAAKDAATSDLRAQLSEMKSQRDSFRGMAREATEGLTTVAARTPRREGSHPPPPRLVSVIPESNSPSTLKQREAAELQTIRNALTAAVLQLGLPIREAAPDAVEPEGGLRMP